MFKIWFHTTVLSNDWNSHRSFKNSYRWKRMKTRLDWNINKMNRIILEQNVRFILAGLTYLSFQEDLEETW